MNIVDYALQLFNATLSSFSAILCLSVLLVEKTISQRKPHTHHAQVTNKLHYFILNSPHHGPEWHSLILLLMATTVTYYVLVDKSYLETVIVQYSQRHTMINHCGRHITHLSDTDIFFVLFNISSKFLLYLECYLLLPKMHKKVSKQIKQTNRYISITKSLTTL